MFLTDNKENDKDKMFFTDDIIKEFRENSEINNYLQKERKTLINLKEIYHFLLWTPLSENLSLRIPNVLSKKHTLTTPKTIFTQINDDYQNNKKERLSEFISKWTGKTCGNSISIYYGANSLTNALSDDNNFDVIFIVDENYLTTLENDYAKPLSSLKSQIPLPPPQISLPPPQIPLPPPPPPTLPPPPLTLPPPPPSSRSHKPPLDIVDGKLNLVHSVMIVEKGECAKKPTTYAINLICSKKTMKANILMGAYLYTIKKHGENINQTGILELAGSFENLPGFCLYTKFGFFPDELLYVPETRKTNTNPVDRTHTKKSQISKEKPKCFGDQRNLAMSVKLNDMSNEISEADIIKTTTQNTPIRNVPISKTSRLLSLFKKSTTSKSKISSLPQPPPPQDLCTTLKGDPNKENTEQKRMADIYSKLYNTDLDIIYQVDNKGKRLNKYELESRLETRGPYIHNINTLRKAIRPNSKTKSKRSILSSFFGTGKRTSKNRGGSKLKKTRSRKKTGSKK